MRNTDHISELIDMSFNGMLFPVRKVIIKGFGERYISTESFDCLCMQVQNSPSFHLQSIFLNKTLCNDWV